MIYIVYSYVWMGDMEVMMTLELRPSTARDRLLRNLDWNLLYLFITIIEEGGITAAAHKLALSQPASVMV